MILQTVAHLQRTPCKAYIFRISLYLACADQFVFFFLYPCQRILFNPIHILVCPFFSIFLVSRDSICLTHWGEPFVAVQLPAQLIVLYRPILPVDIFAVIIRRLISFVHKKRMFQGIIRPFLFFLGDLDILHIDIGMSYAGTLAVIVQ